MLSAVQGRGDTQARNYSIVNIHVAGWGEVLVRYRKGGVQMALFDIFKLFSKGNVNRDISVEHDKTSDEIDLIKLYRGEYISYKQMLEESPFYRPDNRTDEEKRKHREKYLHKEALDHDGGVCSTGQANSEMMIINFDSFTEAVLYSCVLDNHMCCECWPLDGQIFTKDINFRPPVPRHDSCRCLYNILTKNSIIDAQKCYPYTRSAIICDYEYYQKRDPNKLLKNRRRIVHSSIQFKGTAEEWIKTLPSKYIRGFFKTELAYSLWVNEQIKAIDLIDQKTWKLRSDDELSRLFLS